MASSLIGILLVDDFAPFRQFLSSLLGSRPELRIVGEAFDGSDAVRKAQELQPTFILMDVGLPKLNGIEAARQICKVSPLSKIIFVSQQSSPDVVSVALGTGASGYVVKTDVGRELIPALDEVLRGGYFFSSTIRTAFSRTTRAEALSSKSNAFSYSEQRRGGHHHEAAFYSNDGNFIAGFVNFIVPSLKAGNAVIAVMTESHRGQIFAQIHEHGAEVNAAIAQGRFISLDVAETLSAFMAGSLPDRAEFLRVAGDLIDRANGLKVRDAHVAACGECAPMLWTQANAEAAIQVERLWGELGNLYGLDILCGYSLASFQGKMGSQVFRNICGEHSAAYLH